jgi:hypothetical protein
MISIPVWIQEGDDESHNKIEDLEATEAQEPDIKNK